jgi:hypothetical protein
VPARCGTGADYRKVHRGKGRRAGLYESLPDLNPSYRKRARSYLEGFYSAIERKQLARALAEGCLNGAGM